MSESNANVLCISDFMLFSHKKRMIKTGHNYFKDKYGPGKCKLRI